jgi:hypothetical protein
MLKPFQIEIYQTSAGKEPYTEWEGSLDNSIVARIDCSKDRR